MAGGNHRCGGRGERRRALPEASHLGKRARPKKRAQGALSPVTRSLDVIETWSNAGPVDPPSVAFRWHFNGARGFFLHRKPGAW